MLIIRKRRDHWSAKERSYLIGESNPQREIEDRGVHGGDGDQMKKPSCKITEDPVFVAIALFPQKPVVVGRILPPWQTVAPENQ